MECNVMNDYEQIYAHIEQAKEAAYRLKRQLERHGEYDPDVRIVEHWIGGLNEVLFGGLSPKPPIRHCVKRFVEGDDPLGERITKRLNAH
jgi:hypothetical protein